MHSLGLIQWILFKQRKRKRSSHMRKSPKKGGEARFGRSSVTVIGWCFVAVGRASSGRTGLS
jgi:hypothetical protein